MGLNKTLPSEDGSNIFICTVFTNRMQSSFAREKRTCPTSYFINALDIIHINWIRLCSICVEALSFGKIYWKRSRYEIKESSNCFSTLSCLDLNSQNSPVLPCNPHILKLPRLWNRGLIITMGLIGLSLKLLCIGLTYIHTPKWVGTIWSRISFVLHRIIVCSVLVLHKTHIPTFGFIISVCCKCQWLADLP